MPSIASPIFKGAANEKACMKVMSNLKFKGECLSTLHKKVNSSLELIEKLIAKNPTDENKELLLQTLEMYERSKCVATYTTPQIATTTDEYGELVDHYDKDGVAVYAKDKKGNIIYVKEKYELGINTADWVVSTTKAGGVRVHLNKAKADQVKASILKYEHVKDVVVY